MDMQRMDLCDFMNNIDKDIRKKTKVVQNQIIKQKVNDIFEFLKDKEFKRGSLTASTQDIFLSKRQIETFKNSITLMENGELLDAYWELYDFIYNYGSKDNPVLNEGEYELFVFQLDRFLDL